jgi:hypothetical protein
MNAKVELSGEAFGCSFLTSYTLLLIQHCIDNFLNVSKSIDIWSTFSFLIAGTINS